MDQEEKSFELTSINGRGELIQRLEAVITKIKQGEIVAMAWAEVYPEGEVQTRWDLNSAPVSPLAVIGAVTVLQHDLSAARR